MEVTVGENVYLGEIIGGWGGAWAFAMELWQFFPLLDTWAFKEYFEAATTSWMACYSSGAFLRLQQKIPQYSYITYIIGSNPFLSTTSHPSTLCSYFHRMLSSLSTGFHTTAPTPKKQLIVLVVT